MRNYVTPTQDKVATTECCAGALLQTFNAVTPACECVDPNAVIRIDIATDEQNATLSCPCNTGYTYSATTGFCKLCTDYTGTATDYKIAETTTANTCGCFESAAASATQILHSVFTEATGACTCDTNEDALYTGDIKASACESRACSDTVFQSDDNHYKVASDATTSECKCYDASDVEIPDSTFAAKLLPTDGDDCTCNTATNVQYDGAVEDGKCKCVAAAVAVDAASGYCKACTDFKDSANFEVVNSGTNACECRESTATAKITHSVFDQTAATPCTCSCTNCDSTQAIETYKCKCNSGYYVDVTFTSAGCVLCKDTEDEVYTAADQSCACNTVGGFKHVDSSIPDPINVALDCQCDSDMGYAVTTTPNPWTCDCQTGATFNFVAKTYDSSSKCISNN